MSPDPTPSSSQAIVWTDPQRAVQFQLWLDQIEQPHHLQPDSLRLASADASFRRYFRIEAQGGSRIIMDAPPDKENCQPFVLVAALMREVGLQAPEVLDWDAERGFMLLSDLGDQTMLQVMQADDASANLGLYLQAVDVLVDWQKASRPDVLPPYDRALLSRELDLFPQWYIERHKGFVLSDAQRATLTRSFECIIEHNLSWPSVFVHRDFMPRNLMAPRQTGEPLGVLDFQDAVYGPITYDIASLMRDAFHSWDEDFCLDVTIRYWDKARKAGLPVGDDFGEFYRGVEWMGLQRHLKVAGIFARLTLRDGKPRYLADTPRFIGYIRSTCSRYHELKPLLRLVDEIEGIVEPNVFGFGRQ
jgi:aminoglycoside/choline kinase family phosphotransferase